MTSREIIIKLIDSKKINGEEAFTLIRDLKDYTWINSWSTPSYYTTNSSATTYNPNEYTTTTYSNIADATTVKAKAPNPISIY